MEKKTFFRNRRFTLYSAICISLLAATGLFFCAAASGPEREQALNRLAASDYKSVFLSMYDISAFSSEAFSENRGIPTLKWDYCIQNAKELDDALKNIFASESAVTNVFLGLNPFSLQPSNASEDSDALFEDDWLSCIDENPDTSFDILFAFPSMDYWLSLPEETRDRIFVLYGELVQTLDKKDNLSMYYVGGEDWLICNPANYTGSFSTTEQIAEKIFLYTFCDGCYKITAENAAEKIRHTREMIDNEITMPVKYPDLSQYDLVFMGDSNFGNYTGDLSVPNIVGSFSRASVFNCSQGGICAAELAPETLCFPTITAEFLAGHTAAASDTAYGQGIRKYASGDHFKQTTCFLINFGLNDYFNGIPLENKSDPRDISTYTGALRTGITELAKKYPDAIYILIVPGKITDFHGGTDLPNGINSLHDYSAAAASLAEELNIYCLDLCDVFPEECECLENVLLLDGIHYNEHGRFILSRSILRLIAEINAACK